MSRTFRRLKAVFNHDPYPYGPYGLNRDQRNELSPRQMHRAIGDGPKGMWNPPGTFTHQTSTVRLRLYGRQAIHRAMKREDGWDGFTMPRKWPRPWWW